MRGPSIGPDRAMMWSNLPVARVCWRGSPVWARACTWPWEEMSLAPFHDQVGGGDAGQIDVEDVGVLGLLQVHRYRRPGTSIAPRVLAGLAGFVGVNGFDGEVAHHVLHPPVDVLEVCERLC
jgi:hypothetical protein